MAVRNERQRYVTFILSEGSTSRNDMIHAIRSSFSRGEYEDIKPWLTVFEGDRGILRCRHTGAERTREILNSMEVGGGEVKSVYTSGSIKKAKERLYGDG